MRETERGRGWQRTSSYGHAADCLRGAQRRERCWELSSSFQAQTLPKDHRQGRMGGRGRVPCTTLIPPSRAHMTLSPTDSSRLSVDSFPSFRLTILCPDLDLKNSTLFNIGSNIDLAKFTYLEVLFVHGRIALKRSRELAHFSLVASTCYSS
jgi:hypothetical protein